MQRRIWLSAGDAGGDAGGNGGVDGEGNDPPKNTQDGSGNAGGGGGGERKFTQAELDAIIDDRLKRATRKYEGFDDLKRKAAEYDKLDAATKTETQRLADELTAARAQLGQAQAKEREYALRDAIGETVAAADFGYTPTISAQRLIRLLDLQDDDWDGDQPKNVKALLTKLQKSEPGAFAPKSRRPGDGDGGAGRNQPPVGASMNDLIRQAAGRA